MLFIFGYNFRMEHRINAYISNVSHNIRTEIELKRLNRHYTMKMVWNGKPKFITTTITAKKAIWVFHKAMFFKCAASHRSHIEFPTNTRSLHTDGFKHWTIRRTKCLLCVACVYVSFVMRLYMFCCWLLSPVRIHTYIHKCMSVCLLVLVKHNCRYRPSLYTVHAYVSIEQLIAQLICL